MSEEQTPEAAPAAPLSPSDIAKKYIDNILKLRYIQRFDAYCILSFKRCYDRLGNDAFLAKKYDEAIEHYSKGLLLDPENAVFYSNRRFFHLPFHHSCHSCHSTDFHFLLLAIYQSIYMPFYLFPLKIFKFVIAVPALAP